MKSRALSGKNRIDKAIDVDGKKAVMIVDLFLNQNNGTYKIIAPITTKMVSRDKIQLDAMLQTYMDKIREAITDCLEFNAEFQMANKDTARGELFDGEEPEEDEDGGLEDEGEPAGNTLSLEAPPRERRPRRTAHVEN